MTTTRVPASAPRGGAAPALQRQCACGGTPGPTGECAECRRKRRLGLQASPRGEGPPGGRSPGLVPRPWTGGRIGGAPPLVHQVLRSPGQPLERPTREWMEARFGHDFEGVRVHANRRAAESADLLGANAYASGRDIAFAEGRYRPRSPAGRLLLAHELAHVVQQGRARSPLPGSSTLAGRFEAEADRAAAAALRGGTAVLGSAGPAPALQLDLRTFGAGEQLVRIENGVVTVNGERINATVEPDGSLTVRGREVVMDGNGVIRYRDRGTVCRSCNPHYYERPRWRRRPDATLPEPSPRIFDPRSREWTSWNPPVVEQGSARRGVPTDVPEGDIDPRLAEQVREAHRLRTEFETRVQTAMDRGGLERAEAEAVVRERMQARVEGEPERAQLEAGQTTAVSEERTRISEDVVRRRTTVTAAQQGSTAASVTEVPSSTLEAHAREVNERLGTNFVYNRQTLNHAEVRQVVLHPDRAVFYADRPMCSQCQRTFVAEAMARGRELYVVDPEATRVFTPDRRIVELQGETVYARQAAISTDAEGVTRVEISDHPDVVHSVRPRGGAGTSGSPEPHRATSGGGDADLEERLRSVAAAERPDGAPHASNVPERVTASGPDSPATGPTRITSTAEAATSGPERITAPEAGTTPRAGVPERITTPEAGATPRVGVPERIGPSSAPGGTRAPRLGRVGRIGAGAGMLVLDLAMLVADLIIQFIVIPWLERMQRELEADYRRRLEESVRRDIERLVEPDLDRQLYCLLGPIRAAEAGGGKPFANLQLRIFFTEAWTLFPMSQEERMRSILYFNYSHLRLESIDVVTEEQEPSAGEFRESEEEGWNLLTGSHALYEQTMTFSVELPPSAEIAAEFEGEPTPTCGPCFIATACYGSEHAPEVEALRRFRDLWLMSYPAGRLFVRTYYALSPPVADWIRPRPQARRVVRTALVGPLVALVRRWSLDGEPPARGPRSAAPSSLGDPA